MARRFKLINPNRSKENRIFKTVGSSELRTPCLLTFVLVVVFYFSSHLLPPEEANSQASLSTSYSSPIENSSGMSDNSSVRAVLGITAENITSEIAQFLLTHNLIIGIIIIK